MHRPPQAILFAIDFTFVVVSAKLSKRLRRRFGTAAKCPDARWRWLLGGLSGVDGGRGPVRFGRKWKLRGPPIRSRSEGEWVTPASAIPSAVGTLAYAVAQADFYR